MHTNCSRLLWLSGALAACLGPMTSARAASLVVTNKYDSGPGSLREAINTANQNGEPDTISFDPATAEGSIRPREPLPPLTEGGTRIVGDVDADPAPDIVIDGSRCTYPWTCGITIESDGNVISKLVVESFTVAQIMIHEASRNTIRGCRINTNRDGTKFGRDGDGIWVIGGEKNRIGVPGTGGNLILGKSYCVAIMNSAANSVANNLIGTDITGDAALVTFGTGVAILSEPFPCRHNRIGDADAGYGNVIVGPATPVLISGRAAHHNRVTGNYVDLKASGTEPVADRRLVSMKIEGGPTENTVAGNAIFGGIRIAGSGTAENHIVGNYIGLNARGLGSYRGPRGVAVVDRAGRQYIGGETPDEGNHICGGVSVNAIEFFDGGEGSIVRNNVLGANVKGQPSGFADGGVGVYYSDVRIEENRFIGLGARAIYVHDGSPTVVGNTFTQNPAAVVIGELARPNLGNLRNRSHGDDGGNVFLRDNDWFIFSYSRRNVPAENNDFSTSLASEIDAKIWDGRDDPALGWVDFRPFVSPAPTGVPASGPLTVASLACAPTGGGAEVVFSLSRPATVTCTVRNIAGRVVRALRSSVVHSAGSKVILWDGRGDTGCAAPAGRYLVEVEANAEDGQTARRLTVLSLSR